VSNLFRASLPAHVGCRRAILLPNRCGGGPTLNTELIEPGQVLEFCGPSSSTALLSSHTRPNEWLGQ